MPLLSYLSIPIETNDGKIIYHRIELNDYINKHNMESQFHNMVICEDIKNKSKDCINNDCNRYKKSCIIC